MRRFPPQGGWLVSDGGLATELEARGHDLSDPLWSARLLLEDPAEIRATHRAFYRAGARVATTASYQASFAGLAARGIDRAAAEALLRRSVRLARQARTETVGDAGWVAASVGPYGAALADGSEYHGHYGPGQAELAEWHRPRLEALAAAGPDVLACETVPDADEGAALAAALAGIGVPAWLSYTVRGARTRAGQPLDEAFGVAADVPEIIAVGVNCCDPADVAPAIAIARRVTGKPVICYPNSGEGWDPRWGNWTASPTFAAGAAADWVAGGARVVGGCCRVGPAAIAELTRVLGSQPATTV
jgi:homocysteine S-methyltransferase